MTQIVYIGLATTLYTESLYFYRDVLNFEVAKESDGHCTLDAGGLMLHLHPQASESALNAVGHGYYLNIAVNDLTLTRRNLERSGFGILKEWQEGNATFIRVQDPDGNILEITGPEG